WSLLGSDFTKQEVGTLLSNPSVLPNIRSLHYYEGPLDDLLLLHRPIQRISFIGFRPYTVLRSETFLNKRDGLTHISIQHRGVNNILKADSFKERCYELCTSLRDLTALKGLVSVQARYKSPNCVDCHSHIQAFCSGLDDLPRHFPDLVRVFLMRVLEG
ncbi:5790_t:CDS:2, partial [Acaulospora colombiana]